MSASALQRLRSLIRGGSGQRPRVGVVFGGGHVAIAAVSADGQRLIAWDYRDAERESQESMLRSLVEHHGLRGCPAVIVLDGADYQTQQLDAPGIPDEELGEALRFRLKDMLSIPLGEAAVAGHRQRSDRHHSDEGLTLAIIARRRRIDQLVRSAEAADLAPEEVVSRETAMHDLAARMPGAENGVGLLLIGDGAGAVTISRGEDLYLARGHGVSLAALRHGDETKWEQLAFEVQRTIDYFDGQLSSKPLSRVVVLPTDLDISSVVDYLNDMLGVSAAGLNLGRILELPEAHALDDTGASRCLFAIAGALPRRNRTTASLYRPPERERRWDAPAAIAGYVAAAAVVMAVISVIQGRYLASAEERLADVEAERDALLEEVTELRDRLDAREPADELIARRDLLASELELARELHERVEELEGRALDGFSAPLAALGDEELEPVWLSELRISMDAGGFQGFAREAQDVTRFVDYLADRELFRGLSFDELDIDRTEFATNAAAEGGEGMEVYRFSLTTPGMAGLGDPPDELPWADPEIPDLGAEEPAADGDEGDAPDAEGDREETP